MTGLKPFIKNWLLPPGAANLLNDARFLVKIFFARSAEDRRLLKQTRYLKDRHTGQRCFVIGAGSSVASQDLKKLVGECVIGVSNTFVHPDMPFIRPRYHVVPPMIESHGGLYDDEHFMKWLSEMEEGTFDAEMFFHIGDRDLIERSGLFKGRVIHWLEYCPWHGNPNFPLNLARLPGIGSVSEAAITIAVYLGFERVYILGFDHDWFNGPLVYFYDHKTQHAMKPDEKKLGFADAEFQMRRHAEIFSKYKYLYGLRKNIFNANANPNHYLDAFPKVDFDSLFLVMEKTGPCNE